MCYRCEPQPTQEEKLRAQNAAAIRVRARRRIRMSLGVYPEGETQLAPLLKAVSQIEACRREHDRPA